MLVNSLISFQRRGAVLLLKDLDQASFRKVASFNRLLELWKHAVR